MSPGQAVAPSLAKNVMTGVMPSTKFSRSVEVATIEEVVAVHLRHCVALTSCSMTFT